MVRRFERDCRNKLFAGNWTSKVTGVSSVAEGVLLFISCRLLSLWSWTVHGVAASQDSFLFHHKYFLHCRLFLTAFGGGVSNDCLRFCTGDDIIDHIAISRWWQIRYIGGHGTNKHTRRKRQPLFELIYGVQCHHWRRARNKLVDLGPSPIYRDSMKIIRGDDLSVIYIRGKLRKKMHRLYKSESRFPNTSSGPTVVVDILCYTHAEPTQPVWLITIVITLYDQCITNWSLKQCEVASFEFAESNIAHILYVVAS